MKFWISLLVLYSTFVIAQDKASIAVLELEPVGLSHNEAQVLSNRLRTELFKTDKFTVLERDKMDEILIEQGFQLSGCTTNDCVVEAGKLIGVKQMVAGNIAKIDNLFTIDIRLIDVETGEVLKTATEDCACELKDVLTNSIRNVARSMAGLKVEDKVSDVKTYQQIPKQVMRIEDHIDYKSPTKAFLFSTFLPGLAIGQYYNGQIAKGIIQNTLFIGGYLIVYISNQNADDDTVNSLGGVLMLGTWLWSIIDAPMSANAMNDKLKKKYKLSFTPKLNKFSKQPMLGININF